MPSTRLTRFPRPRRVAPPRPSTSPMPHPVRQWIVAWNARREVPASASWARGSSPQQFLDRGIWIDRALRDAGDGRVQARRADASFEFAEKRLAKQRLHFGTSGCPPALRALAARERPGAMLRDRVEQQREAIAGLRRGADDRRLPRPVPRQRQHLREVARRLVRSGPIGLVYDEDIRDLEDARLDRLDVVAEAWDGHEAHRIGDPDHVDLLLSDPHGLDDHDIRAKRVEKVHDANGGAREPARVPTARHRADENPLVEESLAHADAVAEDRTAAEGARRIDRDDGDARGTLAECGRETVHQGGFAAAGRTGDPHDLRAAGLRVQRAHRLCGPRLVVLHDRQDARDPALVA